MPLYGVGLVALFLVLGVLCVLAFSMKTGVFQESPSFTSPSTLHMHTY